MTPIIARDRFTPVRLAEGINLSLERHFWRWAIIFLSLSAAFWLTADLRFRMWYDELITLYMARQGSFADIIKAVADGSDGQPPLYAMIVHLILPAVKDEALAVRLPATLGFCGMVLGLLAFCRRRFSATYSFIAAMVAYSMSFDYAIEGRAYGVVLGCAAGAMLFWQMAAENRHRRAVIPLLALCLSIMVAMHYHAIFFLVPLLLAELVRRRETGKLDFGILAAMAPALMVLGLHYPLIKVAQQLFSIHFWAPASLDNIQSYFIPSIFTPLLLLPIAFGATLIFPRTAPEDVRISTMPLHEWVAVGAIALMPFIVIVLSTYSTHVFVDRYLLWATIGYAVLTGAVLFKGLRGNIAIGVMLFVVMVSLDIQKEISLPMRAPLLRTIGEIYRELDSLPDNQELVVVPHPFIFMDLSYYAKPAVRKRLVYPVSRDMDVRYLGYDTNAILLSRLSRRAPIRVEEYQALVAKNSHFLLILTPADYLLPHLVASGYRAVLIQSGSRSAIYEVERLK